MSIIDHPKTMTMLLRTMGFATASLIVVTLLAGFHLIPGWTPVVPSTLMTMTIGVMLVGIRDADGRAPRTSTRFATLYGWAMIIGSPLAAIAVVML